MPPIFNDSRRELDLKELCAQCGHRNGLHSMHNHCPKVNTNGSIVRHEFESTEFKPGGKYETAEH